MNGAVHFEYLKTKAGGVTRSVIWPDKAPVPSSLNKNKIYTVELLEEKPKTEDESEENHRSFPDLVRLFDGERLLYDASVCHVHGVKMVRVPVPIQIGTVFYADDYLEVLMSQFPNARIISDRRTTRNSRLSKYDWVCSTCVSNKARWQKQQKK